MQISDFFEPSPSLRNTPATGLPTQNGQSMEFHPQWQFRGDRHHRRNWLLHILRTIPSTDPECSSKPLCSFWHMVLLRRPEILPDRAEETTRE
jgi:hypothetical protein